MRLHVGSFEDLREFGSPVLKGIQLSTIELPKLKASQFAPISSSSGPSIAWTDFDEIDVGDAWACAREGTVII